MQFIDNFIIEPPNIISTLWRADFENFARPPMPMQSSTASSSIYTFVTHCWANNSLLADIESAFGRRQARTALLRKLRIAPVIGAISR